jgi:hypothetical protein
MEIVAEFSDNAGLSCKLTNDKLYITSLGNEEVFSLIYIKGIEFYDDFEKYNKKLIIYKKQGGKKVRNKLLYIGLGIIFSGIGILEEDTNTVVISIIIIFIGLNISNKLTEPVLKTYLRLILSNGNRKFLFKKSDKNSISMADFINKVEETLIVYN